MSPSSRSFVWTMAIIVSVASLVASPALALDRVNGEGNVMLPAGEHRVIADFTSRDLGAEWDLGEATTVNYAASLGANSEVAIFDVFLMNYSNYLNYTAGLDFDFIPAGTTLGAGPSPAASSYIFLFSDRYLLLIDNTEAGEAPDTSGVLWVQYTYAGTNMGMDRESDWSLFIALMVVVVLLGATFLILLRMATRHRLERTLREMESRCPHCGGELSSLGEHCPGCGRKR